MSRTNQAIFLILAAAALSPRAFGAMAEPVVIEAVLSYPAPGAVDVAPTTLIFADEVTALTLEGPDGEELPTTMDTSRLYYGSAAFAALDDLSPGTWTVKGLPTPDAVNWAGDDVTVDLGSFTVAASTVPDTTTVWVTSARWTDVRGSSDSLTVAAASDREPPFQPVFLEADLSDADAPGDLEPDLSTEWTTNLYLGGLIDPAAAGLDPETANVRVRLTDAAGNVSDWSAQVPFDVETVTLSNAGCSAAPGASGSAAAPLALLALVLVLVAPRREARRAGAPGPSSRSR